MKKMLHAVLIVCLGCLVGFSPTWAANASYPMSHVCKTEPRLTLTKVTNTKDETILELEWVETMNSSNVGVYPPGHDMAFFITDTSNAKKYHLLDIDGVAIRPNGNYPQRGDVIKFKLVFERIPMNRFHLIEGKLPKDGVMTWHFTNIKLQQ